MKIKRNLNMDDTIDNQCENDPQVQKNEGTEIYREEEKIKGSQSEKLSNPTDRTVPIGAESDSIAKQTRHGCTIQIKSPTENLVIHRDKDRHGIKDTEFYVSAKEFSSCAEPHDADEQNNGSNKGNSMLEEQDNENRPLLNAKTDIGNNTYNAHIEMNADSESVEVGADKLENVSEKNEMLVACRDENRTEAVTSDERERKFSESFSGLSKDERKKDPTSSTCRHLDEKETDFVNSQNREGLFDEVFTESSKDEIQDDPTSSTVTYRRGEKEMAQAEDNKVLKEMSGYQEYQIRETQMSDSRTGQGRELSEKHRDITCWTKNPIPNISTLQKEPFEDSQLLDTLKSDVETKHAGSTSLSKQKMKPLTSTTNASRIKHDQYFKSSPLDFEVFSSKEKKEQLSVFQSESKHTSKMACCLCNRWCLHWNVCKECMIFLCDSCMSLYHPQTLLHATFRAKAFSDFGCLDHMMIFQYFCCDCNSRRCKECLGSRKCKDHVLMDIFTNLDYIEKESGKLEVQASTKMLSKGTRSEKERLTQAQLVLSKEDDALPDDCCKYCRSTHERYNICEDCMVYFCDDCFKRYHPATHTISKSKPFLAFACPEHKQICRHFCELCKAQKCDDCIAKKGKCSGSEHQIIQLLKYISQQKDNFDETIHNVSTASSRTINMLSEQLDKTENVILMNNLRNKEILRQEFASLRHLITEREQQMHRDLEEEYSAKLKTIQQRRRQYGSYLMKDSKLLSKSLHTLGKESLLSFHFNGQTLWKRINQHKRELECLESPDDISVSTLMSQLSLYVEKTELTKSLQLRNSASFHLTCPRHIVYLDDVTDPLRVQDFVNIPSSTLSSTLTMSVEIRDSVKRVVWRTECCSQDECIANVRGKFFLEPKSRYLIKFSLQTTTQVSEYSTTQNISKPCHVLLVTGNEATMDTGSEWIRQACVVGLNISWKESFQIQASLSVLDPLWCEKISFEERRFYFDLGKDKKKARNEGRNDQTSTVGLGNTERSQISTS